MPTAAEDSVCIGVGTGEETRLALDSATSGRAMEEEEENDDDLGPSFQGMCNDFSDVANNVMLYYTSDESLDVVEETANTSTVTIEGSTTLSPPTETRPAKKR